MKKILEMLKKLKPCQSIKLLGNLKEGKFNNTIDLIQFDPTLACNLECEMCPWAKGGYHNDIFYPSEDFTSLYNSLKKINVSRIQIGVDAEPLVHPQINELLKLFTDSSLSFNMLTNLNCRDKETIHLLSKASYIRTSIDGGNKELYEEIRKGGDWDLLCNNLEVLSEKTTIKINWVLLRKNYKTLPQLVKTLNKLDKGGIDEVNIKSPQFVSSKNKEEFSKFFLGKKDIPEFLDVLDKSKRLAEGFSVNYHSEPETHLNEIISSKKRKTYGRYPCFKTLQSLYIDAFGNVGPCCESLFNDFSFGNIKKTDLETIIRSDSFVKLKDSLITLDMEEKPEFCSVCPSEQNRNIYQFLKKLKIDRIFEF